MLKRSLIVLGAAAALLLLVVSAALMFVNTERLKPRLESGASRALGMRVRFMGKIGLHLFPAPHVSLADARILDERWEKVASAKMVRLWLALPPLLRRELRLQRLELEQSTLAIERDAAGKLNVERLQRAVALLGLLEGGSASISDGAISYLDRRTGDKTEVTGLAVRLDRVRFATARGPRARNDLGLDAELWCKTFRSKRLALSDVRIAVAGSGGVFEVKPVAVNLFGARLTGTLRADLTGTIPSYRLDCSLPNFRVEEFLRTLSPEAAADGEMDFSATLASEGWKWASLVSAASGTVSMRGEKLTLAGNDLDRALARFASSRGFNLVDVGAVFLAGPLGLAVTKGYNFASLFRGTGGSSEIHELVSEWKLERGVARATDVAMATRENRIALHGALDLAHERFADMTVAVLDAGGCATVRQTIRGPFAAPVVEKPRMLMSLSAPVRKLYRQARRMFPSRPCVVFYSGSVSQPS